MIDPVIPLPTHTLWAKTRVPRFPHVIMIGMTYTISWVPEIADAKIRQRAVERLRELKVALPTLSELADPDRIPDRQRAALAGIDPDAPLAANLWRVHWFNDRARTGRAEVPGYLVLPEALTGVKARIVVALGGRFPMIGAHKVLAAYGCLVPRLVTGRFDPTRDKAIWPSTGNYCRGGVAISRTLGCRGVAVLPAGMSQERFDWLEHWVSDAADIIRTPGNGEQRQGNLRQVRGTLPRPGKRDRQPVLRIRQLPRPLPIARGGRWTAYSLICAAASPGYASRLSSRPPARRAPSPRAII